MNQRKVYKKGKEVMQNFIFYTLTVIIWGSTWIGIKLQLGTVEPMVSVAYRFTLAATILLFWCFIRRLKMSFTFKEHLFMALQGTLLFALNYWLFYLTELHITSGLAAIIFSTIILMNMVNGALFLKSPFNPKVLIGGIIGLCGISLVFKPELAGLHIADMLNSINSVEIIRMFDSGGSEFADKYSQVVGIFICILATLLASFGNIVSARNQRHGLPIIQTNAYGMAYGAILMLLISLFTGKNFDFVASANYIGALIYLAIFGSIVAFGCYLSLIGRIGADRAAYSTLLTPIVALIISTIWEDYHWSGEAVVGIVLIFAGNLLMINKTALNKILSLKWTDINSLMRNILVRIKNRYRVPVC